MVGGGGLAAAGAVTLSGGQFRHNTATSGDGGALWVNNTVAATQTTFFENTAEVGSGGALYVTGDLWLNKVQLIGNLALLNGGGVYQQGTADGFLVNVVAARNQAGSGAGFYLASAGQVDLLHLTIADPALNSAQGVYVVNGTVNITNTIVASHTVGIQQAGGAVQENYTMFFANTTNTAGGVGGGVGSFNGVPVFVDMTNDDYHVALNSYAHDKGLDTGLSEDFDGEVRPWQDAPEIGIDERQIFRLYVPLVISNP